MIEPAWVAEFLATVEGGTSWESSGGLTLFYEAWTNECFEGLSARNRRARVALAEKMSAATEDNLIADAAQWLPDAPVVARGFARVAGCYGVSWALLEGVHPDSDVFVGQGAAVTPEAVI